MAKQKQQQEEEVLVDVGQGLTRVESFFNENRKSITVIAVGLFVLVGGYFAYLYLYQQPREEKAQQEIAMAQIYFEQDSLNLALQGDGQFYGFEEITEEFSGTKAGNLAHYYAGISYLKKGEYKSAIEHLDEFESDDPVLGVIATGSIGDAFAELGQMEEALEYYERAVSGEENEFIVPFYLMKAGMAAEANGNPKEALEFYERIKEDFPDSQQASTIERSIGSAKTAMK